MVLCPLCSQPTIQTQLRTVSSLLGGLTSCFCTFVVCSSRVNDVIRPNLLCDASFHRCGDCLALGLHKACKTTWSSPAKVRLLKIQDDLK